MHSEFLGSLKIMVGIFGVFKMQNCFERFSAANDESRKGCNIFEGF